MYEHTARKPQGYIIITEPGVPTIELDTYTCKHCGSIFPVIVGHEYGFCMLCMGPTCGAKKCDDHMPLEKKLDDFEKGLLKVLR